MDKFSKVFFAIWMILAIVSFVASFWAPLFFKVLGLVFGSVNMLTIISWVITAIQERKKEE